jgi:hypothetical protein
LTAIRPHTTKQEAICTSKTERFTRSRQRYARRNGPNVYYQLNNDKIIRAYDLIHQFVVDHFNAQSNMLTMS